MKIILFNSLFLGLYILFVSGNLHSQSGWLELNSGTNNTLMAMSIVDSEYIYIVGYGGRILKTTNSGFNWILLSFPMNFNLYVVDFINRDTGFVAGQNNALFETTDGGLSWTSHNFTVDYIGALKILDSSTIIVIGRIATYPLFQTFQLRTTNFGQTWIQTSLTYNDITRIYFINEQVGFLSGYHYVFRTNNSGANWFIIYSNNCVNNHLYNFIDSNVGFMWSDIGIERTTNGGINWSLLYQNSSNYFLGGYFVNNNTGYASGYGTIIKTTNGGNLWFTQYISLNYGLYKILFINNNTGYCIGEQGTILKTTNGGEPIGIQPISNKMPAHFSLTQNYPNPFNPKSNIKFQIAKLGDVKLVIFDVLGREVTTLVNEKLNPGTYEVQWDAGNYHSGVYFYRLVTNEYSETKKMILIK